MVKILIKCLKVRQELDFVGIPPTLNNGAPDTLPTTLEGSIGNSASDAVGRSGTDTDSGNTLTPESDSTSIPNLTEISQITSSAISISSVISLTLEYLVLMLSL
jgi:hypothetical protein